jgi:hypothetical protein
MRIQLSSIKSAAMILGLGVLFGLAGCSGIHGAPMPTSVVHAQSVHTPVTATTSAPAEAQFTPTPTTTPKAINPRVAADPTPVVTAPNAIESAPFIASFSAAGDSITATDQGVGPGSVDNSWTTYAGQVPTVSYDNQGFTHSGYTAEQLAAGATHVTSAVMVIAVGTNDIGPDGRFFTVASSEAAVLTIAYTAAAPHTIIAAIPPEDRDTADATAWNTDLQALAVVHGWTFVDPWAAFRSPTNSWIAGDTIDGLHPTIPVAQQAGAVMGAVIATVAHQ